LASRTICSLDLSLDERLSVIRKCSCPSTAERIGPNPKLRSLFKLKNIDTTHKSHLLSLPRKNHPEKFKRALLTTCVVASVLSRKTKLRTSLRRTNSHCQLVYVHDLQILCSRLLFPCGNVVALSFSLKTAKGHSLAFDLWVKEECQGRLLWMSVCEVNVC
jgi:hypothetical protein